MTQPFFDGSNVDTKVLDSIGMIPDGEYKCVTSLCEKKRSDKDASVAFMKVEFEIVEGDYMGRKVFNNFLFMHSSEKAVRIGKARFKNLCIAATGIALLERADDIYGKPIFLKLENKTQKDGRNSLDIVGIAGSNGFPEKKNTHPSPNTNNSAGNGFSNLNHTNMDDIPF